MEILNSEELRTKILEIIENETDNQKIICELEELLKPLNKDKNLDADIKSCVDNSFKNILLNYSKKNVEIKIYETLIDLSIITSKHDLCTSNLAIILLTDLFEYHTTSECEKLFDLLEKRIDVWKDDLFFKNVKNQLLRTCNDLLRRLSRSQNTVFCGRILVFLANFFPFFERSGLNLISEFNNDESMHVIFDEEINELDKHNNSNLNSQQSEIEDGLILTNEKDIILDFELYKKFWSLQIYFRDPTKLFKILHWKQFTESTNETIDLFSNFKIDNTNCNLHSLDSLDSNYFPKYLTSQKLLELQLCDPNFRCNILIQFLIIFQYLIGKIKFKTDYQALNEDQLKWIKETTDKVLELIGKTSTNSERIKQTITHILTREEFWSNWKNESCIELKKCNEQPPNKKQKTLQTTAKISLGDRIKNAEDENKIIIGSEQLTKCWNSNQNNWDSCKDSNRVFVPKIEDYFADVMTKEGLEYKHFFLDDVNYCWRALRLLCKASPLYFPPSNTNTIKSVKEYIGNIINTLSNDNDKLNNETNHETINNDESENKINNGEDKPPVSNSSNSNNSDEMIYNLE